MQTTFSGMSIGTLCDDVYNQAVLRLQPRDGLSEKEKMLTALLAVHVFVDALTDGIEAEKVDERSAVEVARFAAQAIMDDPTIIQHADIN